MSSSAADGGRESRVFPGLPPYGRGQRIGLYGGSFNPAHQGHRQASLLALKQLELDWIWWLVTPGNPLKGDAALPSMAARMAAAAKIAAHPRIVVSGVEARFGTRFTADLLRRLIEQAGDARFVWIMGSDNLAQFHRWERWREIAATVPIAVVNRPGSLTAPLHAPAAQGMAGRRVETAELAGRDPPAWAFLVGPRTAASSTAIRGDDA